jgi:tetratricopeptide (TPR) repeat protein
MTTEAFTTDQAAAQPGAAGNQPGAAPGQPGAAAEQPAERIVLPDAPPELRATLDSNRPVAWSEPLAIRTYETGEPSPYPMYLDRRVYQGSSGKVYPIPFTEKVSDEPVTREWQAVHLENAYLRLVVLPELGGRIHIGYDKTTDYDFFYRNNVIKPALVGLAGPWVSGGVEFNWPQHHRPATYLPVETTIEYDDDGTVTVWCSDHDPFTRMAGQHGVRLRPDSSVIELAVRLHNRTSERQTFLWWANVAARVHDDYQSFFPEDVGFVADHARRAITAFPSADRPYYGVDYPALAAEHPGADRIDWYRNIPVPTSYMIVDSAEDFFGGYDHAAGAGFVHWAERRLSPGKKQWTWGDAPFGHAWDAQLTDHDGPYVELMAGVYTDNQPDFSWLLPGETKVFSQYWYPVPGIGVVHQATPDAAVHVEREGAPSASFAVTAPQPGAVMRVTDGDGTTIASQSADLVPGVPVTMRLDRLPVGASVELVDQEGRSLVRWSAAEAPEAEPWVAEEPALPQEIDSVEELYLTGVHLSQFRHPTRSPLGYWHTALERDPGDVRTNLALADHHFRAGEYETALALIETALQRLTRRNANPQDAEGLYLAGLVLRRLGRDAEAETYFGKAGWDGTWAAAAGYELAASLSRRGCTRAALRVLGTLDDVVAHDSRRAVLAAVLLRRSGRPDDAEARLRAELVREPLNPALQLLLGSWPADPGQLVDVALELRAAGDDDGALAVLSRAAATPATAAGAIAPVAHYLAAGILEAHGDSEGAAAERRAARSADLTRAFPSGLDAHDALRDSLRVEPDDATARLLLGMLLYGHGRREDALEQWERAIELGLEHPVLYRNAGLAAYNVAHDDDGAWRRYGQALAMAPDDARLLYEVDQLAARLGHPAAARLARLASAEQAVLERDDLTISYVRLLVSAGEASRAQELLLSRTFHPWEGGEGEVIRAWDDVTGALGLGVVDPPATLGEARPRYEAPRAVGDDGVTDYFATSLPELLLFTREEPGA